MIAFFVAALFAAPVSTDCAQVRAVRALAAARSLDETTLVALERVVCSVEVTTPISGDCRALSTMERLARLAGDATQLPIIAGAASVACVLAEHAPDHRIWPNGSVAHGYGGAWYYPNGAAAGSFDGTLYYPKGAAARSYGGTLFYPNGATARSLSGQWYLPSNAAASEDELLSGACAKLGPTCGARIAELNGLCREDRTLALLELAWSSR